MTERVVSLAPSATAVLQAIDAEDRLVAGTSHGSTGRSIGGWLTPDLDAVAALEPDCVLTTDDLQSDIADTLRDRGLPTFHRSPETIPDVFGYIREIGEVVGRPDAADDVASEVERRIDAVRRRVGGRERPVVYCEEWDEPPMVAGNWVPEIIAAAGGRYPFCAPGDRSRPIDVDEIERHAPEYAIVHLCGRGTTVDPQALDRRGWAIPRVEVIDDSLLNQPGPQLAEATERIATVLHPDAMDR